MALVDIFKFPRTMMQGIRPCKSHYDEIHPLMTFDLKSSEHILAHIFKRVFLNETDCILTEIKLKFVPENPTDHKSALVQVRAWKQITSLYLDQLERLRPPPPTPWLPILVIHIRSQVKRRQSQIYKFKKIAKNSNFDILQETIHATHLLKLLAKMHKYEMDATRTVGAKEWTQDSGRTDRRTDGVKPIYPTTTWLCGGYNDDPVHCFVCFTNPEWWIH